MPYVAPSTKSAYTTLTTTEWNTVVNDVIDLNLRANTTRGTYAARPVSPALGDFYYQTDTDELLKYATDLDGQNRWMQADHDYRRNVAINGGFDVWQRGTTFNPNSITTTTGANYGPDRWQCIQSTNQASAFARVAITSSDPAGFNYYMRVGRTSGQSYTTAFTLQTSFESQNIQQFRGKYVTLSFWARCSSPYSAASSFLVSDIVTGTGTNNTVGNFTSNTVNTTTNNVLTTSWKRFSITTSAALATSITQLGVRFVFTPVGTAPANDYFDITGVQVETGTAPSDFEFRDISDETDRCQRYYFRIGPGLSNIGPFGTGANITTTSTYVLIPFPTTMRITPAGVSSPSGASRYAIQIPGSTLTCTAVSFGYMQTTQALVRFDVASGLTAGNSSFVYANTSADGYISFDAEL